MASRGFVQRSADIQARASAGRSPAGRSTFARGHRSEREADAAAAVLDASRPVGELVQDGALPAGTSATELTTVIETDLAAYRFLAWHVVVGANLEGMRSDLDDLIGSFDADDFP